MSRSEREREQGAAAPRGGKKWRRTALGQPETRASSATADDLSRTPSETHVEPATVAGESPLEAEDESFAARLRYLFAATRQPNGRPWSANAVARASGGRLTAQAVYSLYRGATPNPKLETILALAEVLSVDPEYFVSPGALSRLQARHAEQYEALEADPSIAFVSRRMGRMTPADKAIIVAMVQRLTGASSSKEQAADQPLDAERLPQMRQDLPE